MLTYPVLIAFRGLLPAYGLQSTPERQTKNIIFSGFQSLLLQDGPDGLFPIADPPLHKNTFAQGRFGGCHHVDAHVGASGSLWRTCSDRVSQRRVAMEVAGLAVWGGAQRRTKLTDEQVPLFLSALVSVLLQDLGTIGPKKKRHQNGCRCSLSVFVLIRT